MWHVPELPERRNKSCGQPGADCCCAQAHGATPPPLPSWALLHAQSCFLGGKGILLFSSSKQVLLLNTRPIAPLPSQEGQGAMEMQACPLWEAGRTEPHQLTAPPPPCFTVPTGHWLQALRQQQASTPARVSSGTSCFEGNGNPRSFLPRVPVQSQPSAAERCGSQCSVESAQPRGLQRAARCPSMPNAAVASVTTPPEPAQATCLLRWCASHMA